MRITWCVLFLFLPMVVVAEVRIPEIKNPQHEIGYVCLREIQGGTGFKPLEDSNERCGPPFHKYEKGTQLKEEYAVPLWAKKANGETLTREEWAKIPVTMTGYEEGYGFAVWGSRQDAVELRFEGQSVWIPKSKIQQFYPLGELALCGVGGEKWWQQLYRDDLKTNADLDFSKSFPGEPFRGIEPAGVLEVKLNEKSQICMTKDECVSAKVPVDKKIFKQDDFSGARPPRVTALNLDTKHFKGQSIQNAEIGRFDYLVVMDQKTDHKYKLQTAVYDEPAAWVKIPKHLQSGVKFLPVQKPEAAGILNGLSLEFPRYSQTFLQQASFIREGEKWHEGQLWIKAKVHFIDACIAPDLSEKKVLGQFWIPYSKNMRICAKGC